LNIGAGGGGHVQNVALILPDGSRGDLVALLMQSDYALLGLVFGDLDAYHAQECQALEERYPVRFLCVRAEEGSTSTFPTVIDAEGHLADQIGASGNDIAIIRPDLHLAGLIDDASPNDIEHALRTVLGVR
jgi:hypothetical protein